MLDFSLPAPALAARDFSAARFAEGIRTEAYSACLSPKPKPTSARRTPPVTRITERRSERRPCTGGADLPTSICATVCTICSTPYREKKGIRRRCLFVGKGVRRSGKAHTRNENHQRFSPYRPLCAERGRGNLDRGQGQDRIA